MTGISSRYQAIYRIVSRIPQGKVATYGQVARLAGLPGHARQVGYALSALPERLQVPWHRVVNAQGRISCRSDSGEPDLEQRLRLEHEGVRFDSSGRIALDEFQWKV